MRRRGNSEGSIYQRAGRRGWYAAVSHNGRRKVLRGDTRQEVARKMSDALSARGRRPVGYSARPDGRGLPGDLALRHCRAQGPAARTAQLYEYVIRGHIAPVIGNV